MLPNTTKASQPLDFSPKIISNQTAILYEKPYAIGPTICSFTSLNKAMFISARHAKPSLTIRQRDSST